ncbi:hypothetical protein F4692_002837 [Nocardioides cavernae]|uniref:Nuclear transport factor 2 family protein n=1 Tax=Nocardioides cavernae TaxID=1921566 RepID=A0A7Y9H5K7_9ACTN|nr:hypothetical protein [Nocardioides cavernae]NYE37704.1 hypothetical protein [Nocardioides cavernae]
MGPLPALLALLVALLAGCQSHGGPGAAPERPSRSDDQVTLSSHGVPTKVGIHRVHGRLPVARRKAVRRQVGAVVDAWWDAAYLGGTYPRSAFPAAFPGFTDAAEQRAREDKALLTNQTGGPRIDSVTARRRTVTLDILATGRQARAVTAHFVLAFDTTGDKTGTTTVRGRLYLTHRRGAWRVFGYDVAKGSR